MENIYRTSIISPNIVRDSHQLKNRWSLSQTELIRKCIENGKDIPSIFPDLTLSFFDTEKSGFLDLRGLNLSEMKIAETDFAYCVLDYANFCETYFIKTKLQYSRMISTDFSMTHMQSVQMAPVDAMHANFNDATIKDSFLMHSNLDFIESNNLNLLNTDVKPSSLRKANSI